MPRVRRLRTPDSQLQHQTPDGTRTGPSTRSSAGGTSAARQCRVCRSCRKAVCRSQSGPRLRGRKPRSGQRAALLHATSKPLPTHWRPTSQQHSSSVCLTFKLCFSPNTCSGFKHIQIAPIKNRYTALSKTRVFRVKHFNSHPLFPLRHFKTLNLQSFPLGHIRSGGRHLSPSHPPPFPARRQEEAFRSSARHFLGSPVAGPLQTTGENGKRPGFLKVALPGVPAV